MDEREKRRSKNVEIFNDTCDLINDSISLQKDIDDSIKKQKLYLENDNDFEIKNKKRDKKCEIVISSKRTYEAAKKYTDEGKKVVVLNFASATHPGGGVTHGSSAQEEALCRCSTLYKCLNIDNMWDDFYLPHRYADNPLYNDDILYTPDVVVVKTDTDYPERMDDGDWYKVDVITCAAPNLKHVPSTYMNSNTSDYENFMRKRIDRIFKVALTSGDDVLILGAFGCGAFYNPPKVVSRLFKEAVDKYNDMFDTIEFAIYHTPNELENYNSFKEAFDMDVEFDLSRFIDAQEETFEKALSEIKDGKKQSHWMWYIFPQIEGLGYTSTSRYYAIKSLKEAKAYLENTYLSNNMEEICNALLECESSNPTEIMGYPDDLKLKSSMTLFSEADPKNKIYTKVLDKFYSGKKDEQTLEKLK